MYCHIAVLFYGWNGAYERKLHSILRAYPDISCEIIKSWWNRPQFFEYWRSQLMAANPLQADTACIFSAHSVPTSTVGSYEDEVMFSIKIKSQKW